MRRDWRVFMPRRRNNLLSEFRQIAVGYDFYTLIKGRMRLEFRFPARHKSFDGIRCNSARANGRETHLNGEKLMDRDADALMRGEEIFAELNPKAQKAMVQELQEISPDLMTFATRFAFGDLFARDNLPRRDRQLVTVTALAMRGDAANQLRVHIDIALNIGISAEDLAEAFLQLAPYGGFPTAINATKVLRDAVAARSDS